MTDGRNVVFFSGGMDSTLIAVDLLRSREVVTLINFDNGSIGGEGQQNKEQMRIKQIVQRMRTEFGGSWVTLQNILWDGSFEVKLQLKWWCSLFPLCLKEDDKVYFGAIRYSDFWHWKDDWEKAFNATLKCHGTKNVTLNYPLAWEFKHMVKKRLKKVGYYDLAIHSGDSL